jgi:hypothetical protein
MPERHWLRFSIRTLLIAVTIFCLLLGHECKVVRERKALVDRIQADDGECIAFAEFADEPLPPGEALAQVRATRRLMGDQAWFRIDIRGIPERGLLQRVDAAFPEAEVWITPRYFGPSVLHRASPLCP